jgi:hypothetical protein
MDEKEDTMRRKMIGLFLSLALYPCAACDEEGSGEPQLDIAASCSRLVQHCPTGYSWSYYVTDEAGCRDIFNCVHDDYSGSCRDTLESGMRCLADVESSAGCADCDAILSSLATTCPYPASCLP